MRESKIEKYLNKRVADLGGVSIKIKFHARRNCPDRLVLFPPHVYFTVETKAPGKSPTKAQVREHIKLGKYGATVLSPNTLEGVDAAISIMREEYFERTGCYL